jgi:alpha-beta hydrolase superfamily lysophospholipase
MRRRLLLLGAALLALMMLIYAGVSIEAANRLSLGTHKALHAEATAVSSAYEDVSFPSRTDHLTLRGWLYHAGSQTGRSFILVHGRDQNRVNADFGGVKLARDVLAHGYDVLLFDLRSSGTSDGDRFTLGTLEPRDVLGAYDYMVKRNYRPERMAILGDSMGAAAVIQAAPDLLRVGALVADSGFARLRSLLDAQLPYNTKLPRFFYPGLYGAGVLFGLNSDLKPVDTVRRLPNRAFLLFAGMADNYVPDTQSMELKAASPNPETVLVRIPGADHVKSFKTAPAIYLETLYQFMDQQIAEHGG